MAIDIKLKDSLIVSILFFIIGSDWFDNWLKDLFPQLRTSNPIMYTLIKTVIFFGVYWLYKYFVEKQANNNNTSLNPPARTTT